MQTQSIWPSLLKEKTTFPRLNKNIKVNVLIIGGGITGTITAFELLKARKKIALIDSSFIGYGTTGFSTGNLYVPVEPLYQIMESKFDRATVKQVMESRKHAIDYLEDLIRTQEINCHFARRPWFMYSNRKENLSTLDKEFDIFQSCGMDIKYTEMDLPAKYIKAAMIDNQARFNPLEFVSNLATLIGEQGCEIYEQTPVLAIEDGKQVRIKTPEGEIIADEVIIATHTPIGIHPIHMYLAPYRSYAVAAKLKSRDYPKGHYWDLDEPGYISSTHSTQSKNLDMLIVAGSHHKVGQCRDALKNFRDITAYIHHHYDAEVVYQWSAQHYQSMDNIPYVGALNRKSKNIYMATGFFADGLTYGTVAGRLLTDLILKKHNSLQTIYDSKRFTLRASFKRFVKENFNNLLQYLKDLPINTTTRKLSQVRKGQGKTIELEGQKFAVFRDDEDNLHIVSAVCTHMKCIVNWNNAEKTWDCPCHGSRFSVDGDVLEGPALHKLEKKNIRTES